MLGRLITIAAGTILVVTAGGTIRGADATHPRNAGKPHKFVVTANDRVPVRREPSAKSPVVVHLPTLTEVVVLDEPKKPAVIAGRKDRWVHVHAIRCLATDEATPPCGGLDEVGWVPDSALAYDNRFKAVSKWRKGKIDVFSGDQNWIYRLASNGRFTFTEETRETIAPGERCEGRLQAGECIVKIVRKGRLYRYGKVVRPGRKSDTLLFIDRRGRLCDPKSSPEEPLCAR